MKRKYVDERGYVEYDPDGAPAREDFVWPEAKPLPKRKEKNFERWRPRKNPWNVFTDEPIRDWRLNWRYPEWHLQGLLKDFKEARELYSFAMRRKDVWIEDDKERFMKLYSIWLRSNAPKKHQPKSKRETAADVLASLSDYREVETAADVLAAIRNDPGLLKESAEDVLAAVARLDSSEYGGQGMYSYHNRTRSYRQPTIDTADEIRPSRVPEVFQYAFENPDNVILFRAHAAKVLHSLGLIYLSDRDVFVWIDSNDPRKYVTDPEGAGPLIDLWEYAKQAGQSYRKALEMTAVQRIHKEGHGSCIVRATSSCSAPEYGICHGYMTYAATQVSSFNPHGKNLKFFV
jgi:hypothetical protein